LYKPSPTKRIPIDTHTSGKAESKMEIKDTNATKEESKIDPTSRTSSKVTNTTNENVDKHGSIYQSSDNSKQLDAHDDVKTLLIVQAFSAD